ncbi:BspA family leucine-rich repeat surface protein [Helicobacter sp. 23-1045]
MAKYTPKNKYELKKLVADESIYLGDIDTSNITDMEGLFYYRKYYLGYQSERRDFSGIETWDTSNVVTMSLMFSGNKHFNHNINSWNVSRVVDMQQMFSSAESFNQPLNNWNISNVVNMCYMFSGAKSFNQPLDNWDTSNVKIMGSMFYDAKSFNQNLDLWNIDSVVSNVDMFKDSGMKTLPKWWCDKVIENPQGRHYFSIEEATKENYVSKAMRKHITKDAQSGKYIPKTRNELWALCYGDEISLSDIDTSNIIDMNRIFDKSGRKDFSGIETWDTSKVVDMSFMFSEIDTFNKNISSWNISNVVSMYCMFKKAKSFNQPLDNWDTSSVEFMGSMFEGAKSFNQNIDSWNVGNVRDNVEMFWDSGVDKLPKWYKKKEIGNKQIMGERIAEVLANPQAKAKPKPQQSKVQSGDFDFWQGKNTIIIVIVALLIGVSIGFIKSKFKESNKAKSPPTQTTQPMQTQKPQPTQSTKMPRCDNKNLLNHLIKTDKEGWVKYINKDIEFWERTQELGKEKGLNLTDINDYIENRKYDIISVETKSHDVANRRVVCKAEVTQTDLLLFPNEPLQTSWNYIVQLNNDNSISWGWVQSDNP